MDSTDDTRRIARDFVAERAEATAQVRGWVEAAVRSAWRFEDPESVTQEIMLELLALARAGKIRPDAAFRGYVRTVTRHSCIDALRRQRMRRPVETAAVEIRGERTADDPETDLVARQRLAMARYVMQSLSADCRTLLGLVFGQGLRAREVGERLGITDVNVRVRTHRCLERARELRRSVWGTENGR